MVKGEATWGHYVGDKLEFSAPVRTSSHTYRTERKVSARIAIYYAIFDIRTLDLFVTIN